jgi:hypothetical protein
MTPDCLYLAELDVVHTPKDFSVQSCAPVICPSMSYFGRTWKKIFQPNRSVRLFEQVI